MHIKIQVNGLAVSELGASTEEALSAAFAHSIASICGVSDGSIVDAYGSNASVTIGASGELSAFVLADTGYSAMELQSRLSSTPFQKDMANSAAAIVAGGIALGTAAVDLERFAPLPSTSRASTGQTTTATAIVQTTTSTTSNSSFGGAASHADADADADADAGDADQQGLGLPAWVLVVIGSVVFACLFLCVHRVYRMLTRKQPKNAADEEAGTQSTAPESSSQYGLPVLLGGVGAHGGGMEKDGGEASTTSGDQTHGSLRASDILRTSLDNVEEGGLWHDNEQPVHDCTRTDYDCTKGCNVSCW